ncbi:MAG: DUF1614 domain-containing protein [Pyrobaculum sp.]
MRIVITLPFHGALGLFYAALSVLLLPLFATSFVEVLRAAGIRPLEALLLGITVTFLSLVTSPVNVVVYTLSRREYVPVVDYVVVFGFPIPVPKIAAREERSYIAVNIGGAVVPLVVATYLLLHVKTAAVLASVAVASILTNMVSKVVPNLGVVTPALAPPLIAALSALLAGGGPIATYITAVYGTIIGADLLNMGKVLRHRPPFVSIGGAGVFDGIFLSGVLAVALSTIF